MLVAVEECLLFCTANPEADDRSKCSRIVIHNDDLQIEIAHMYLYSGFKKKKKENLRVCFIGTKHSAKRQEVTIKTAYVVTDTTYVFPSFVRSFFLSYHPLP